MNSRQQLQQLRDLVAPVCQAHGVDLVDVRMAQDSGAVLRVLIEQPGADPATGSGVTLEDCQRISRALSELVDEAPDTPGVPQQEFRLEVGSPGVERPLFGLEDYRRFTGREAKVHCIRPIEGRRRFAGPLLGVEGPDVIVKHDGEPIRIPHSEVVKAHLVYRF